MGSIYQRGGKLWIKYYRNGVPMRESANSNKEKVAKELLRQREGDIAKGVPVTPQTNRCTVDELLDDVIADYKMNGKRSLANVERIRRLYLEPFFRGRKAAAVTTADLRAYVVGRQAAKAKNSTVNRELGMLRRGFSLGVEAGKVTTAPKVPMLREDNIRAGFFEPAQFAALCAHLPAAQRAVVRFAYLTGWRTQSEVLPLQWRQIDFAGGAIRLDPHTTKNGEGRVFPMTAELRALLSAQRAQTDAVQRTVGAIIPHVFFHRDDGRPILNFRKAWENACTAAGCPGRIIHDLRRTAVRNLVRAGIPERVAMQMTGHKTLSVFERYNIVSEGDLTDAARRLDGAGSFVAGTIPGTTAQTGDMAGEVRTAK